MAETNISADKTTGQVIEAEHVNELKNAMVTVFSGRDSSGTVKAGQQLGSATYPWGLAYINSMIVNGSLIDFSALTTESNIIQSGKTRTTSDLPDFIRAAGSTNSATIQGATTNLITVVNGTTQTVSTDETISSLTTASSGAASECLINDANFANQLTTKYSGGEKDSITVDTMGANISAKVGEYVCLKASSEYMLAYVESTTELTNIKRGFFFDSSGNPIVRETLSNNDTLSLMSLGWVFLEDATTFDVTYNAPVYDYAQPSSPATGDYWFDLQNKQWRRYNGADFVVINRILIGLVVIDTANCVASRSIDFDLAYSDRNSVEFLDTPFSTEIIQSQGNNNVISVNANTLEQRISKVEYNITTDLDSGVSETSSTTYYLYISQDGQNIISDERPYDFNPKLQGYYHPYQTWRCVGSFFNDGSSNIESVESVKSAFGITDYIILDNQIELSNNGSDSDHDIDFTAGTFEFDDFSGQATASALTKQLDNSWVAGNNQGGLDTGTVAADTIYYMFAIWNPKTSTADFLFSASSSSPTLPSGYTKKKRIASLQTDGSSNIRNGKYNFFHGGYRFDYNARITQFSGATPASFTDLNLDAPPFSFALLNGEMAHSGAFCFYRLRSKVEGDIVEAGIIGNIALARAAICPPFPIKTDSNSDIQHGFSGGACNIFLYINGWIEYL